MLKWMPCELHAHTVHSDGSMTLPELAQNAKSEGIACVALTDHNTVSGCSEIAEVMRNTGILIIPGLEWTTFYGHAIALGVHNFIDWKTVTPYGIDEGFDRIHSAGGLAGIAHPFRMGSPVYAGCHWDFQVRDWTKPDYIEVWSETFPAVNPANQRAFALWTQLLDKGCRLVGLSGRDWHSSTVVKEPCAVTCVGVDPGKTNDPINGVLDALRRGRVSATMGPLLNLDVKTQSNGFVPGDTIVINSNPELAEAEVSVDLDFRRGKWELDSNVLTVVLNSNKGELVRMDLDTCEKSFSVSPCGLLWLRAELFGMMRGIKCMVAFTNPVFFTTG